MPKNNAIKPNSLMGGDISNMNKASEMARMRMMPSAKRAGIGVGESVDFIKIFAAETHTCLICYEMLKHFKNHGRCQGSHGDSSKNFSVSLLSPYGDRDSVAGKSRFKLITDSPYG